MKKGHSKRKLLKNKSLKKIKEPGKSILRGHDFAYYRSRKEIRMGALCRGTGKLWRQGKRMLESPFDCAKTGLEEN